MFVQRTLACLACAAAWLLPAASQAQGVDSGSRASGSSSLIGAWPARGYLGLSLGHSRNELSCRLPDLGCENAPVAAHLYGGYMLSRHVALEVGYLDLARLQRELGPARPQGLNLSLVGRARVGPSLGLFGHLGTTYGRADAGTAALPATEAGFGLSYGAGVSWSFSPRGSATLGWDSQELRLPGTGRDTMHSARLGLQWRY